MCSLIVLSLGVAGWQASFLLTFCMSVGALVVWYLFSVAHVIPALNSPTPPRLSVTADVDHTKAASFAVTQVYRKKVGNGKLTSSNSLQNTSLTDSLL